MISMVAAIKNGDEKVFRECFFSYQNKLFAYFVKKDVPEQDALDLVQSVFLKLWQYRQSMNDGFNISQHIFQIARTAYIDYLRLENKRACQSSIENNAIQHSANNPSEDFDLRQQLQKALESMPEMRRKVFELNRMKGYSYLEIASFFSISVKSVDNHITKAVRQLRQAFGYISIFCIFFL